MRWRSRARKSSARRLKQQVRTSRLRRETGMLAGQPFATRCKRVVDCDGGRSKRGTQAPRQAESKCKCDSTSTGPGRLSTHRVPLWQARRTQTLLPSAPHSLLAVSKPRPDCRNQTLRRRCPMQQALRCPDPPCDHDHLASITRRPLLRLASHSRVLLSFFTFWLER